MTKLQGGNYLQVTEH